MSRREFLRWAGALSVSGCAAPRSAVKATATAASPPAAPAVRAVAFDLFTLFDPRGVDQRVAAVVGDNPAFAATWKTKLFEYSWLRAASGQYRDFENLAGDALTYSARAHDLVLSDTARSAISIRDRAPCALSIMPSA